MKWPGFVYVSNRQVYSLDELDGCYGFLIFVEFGRFSRCVPYAFGWYSGGGVCVCVFFRG